MTKIPPVKEFSVERGRTGAWNLAVIYNGSRIHQSYFDYSKREAVQLFREHLKSISMTIRSN